MDSPFWAFDDQKHDKLVRVLLLHLALMTLAPKILALKDSK